MQGVSRDSVVLGASIPSLVRWGVSADADLIFRTLRTLGRQSPSMLGRSLGIPARRVDDALAELRSLQAVALTRTGEWYASPPDEVIAGLVRPRRPHKTELIPAPEVIRELGPGLRHLSRAATRHRLASLVEMERHEHLVVNPEVVFEVASTQAAAPLDRSLLDRGIAVRELTAVGNIAPESAGTGPCVQQREAERVPMKLIIIDRRVALFPVDAHDYDRGYLEATEDAVVASLCLLFEQHWGQARPIAVPAGPPLSLSHREQRLVDLLSAGHTDAGAARQLRVSERTVSSILRQLMDRLGVDNRFQLGLVLGARGATYIPPAPGR
ncbi:helix-turn-helix transcriptional regulator [Hamadaea tsunoensis]|uniref:helix-turn-helix transcriptional regulator n=1 Tax=Hamadaea tsunoensis TaxID=53368 RepID=UPI0003F7C139|nr:helix-turn-helix transcriptional regulator [Hamadaea tsunoensis]